MRRKRARKTLGTAASIAAAALLVAVAPRVLLGAVMVCCLLVLGFQK